MHYSVEHFEVWIAFFKFTHILVQQLNGGFPIFRANAAVLGIAEHHDYLLKEFFFFALSDVFVVVRNSSVGAFLSCVILGESFIKKLVIQLTQVTLHIGYVVRRSGFIHIVREEISVVVFNAPVVRTERN